MRRLREPGNHGHAVLVTKGATMRVIKLGTADPQVDAAYADVLVPSFPADELITASALRNGLARGRYTLAAIFDGHRPAAAAVVHAFPEADVLLLLYLGVRPGCRGQGYGSVLLAWVRDEWLACGAHALLAEIEHPAVHPGGPRHGDPVARLRFYARHGGRAVDLPYFQPALGRHGSRVYGLILAVLAIRDDPADTVPAEAIRRFLAQNLERAEGRVGTDPDVLELWQRLAGVARLPLLPLDDVPRLPLSAAAPEAAARD